MMNCDVIRDLLPLYADDVCSAETRRMVDEHTRQCPACAKMLKQIRADEIETSLREEKNEVILYQAKRFKRRSATIGTTIAGLFMIPILVCLIVNLCTGAALDWFYVVLAGMAVAASVIVVPLMAPRDKLFWTFCAFTASTIVLLGVVCLYSKGDWFLAVESAFLFGMAVVFLPFLVRARPLQRLLGSCNRALLVVAVDVILFTNMMNMITLHTKGLFTTLRLALFCLLAAGLVALLVRGKQGKGKR